MTASPFDRIRFFARSEFDSPDLVGSGASMDIEFMLRLDCLRGWFDKPFIINSGFRTSAHNKKIGGAPNSGHRFGKACDISTRGWDEKERWRFLEEVRKFGFTGVGVSPTFIHLDTMPRIASWRYTVNGHEKVVLGQETDFA